MVASTQHPAEPIDAISWRSHDAHGHRTAESRYPPKGFAVSTIAWAVEFLGDGKIYRLNKALGLENGSTTVFYWLNGRQRPSALYLDRILKLVQLKLEGGYDYATFNPRKYWATTVSPAAGKAAATEGKATPDAA